VIEFFDSAFQSFWRFAGTLIFLVVAGGYLCFIVSELVDFFKIVFRGYPEVYFKENELSKEL
jgi:Na+/serine symporter